jgi:hypothetical protein
MKKFKKDLFFIRNSFGIPDIRKLSAFVYLIPFILMLFMASVMALEPVPEDESYQYIGYNNYRATEGGFFGTIEDYSESFRYLSQAGLSPLTADLNQDGILEIVIFDGENMRLYHGASLEIVDSFATGLGAKNVTAWIGNLDNDSYLEIVVAEQFGDTITILQYNGTSISAQKTFEFVTTDSAYFRIIRCSEDDKLCVLLSADDDGGVNTIDIGLFNISGGIQNINIATDNFDYFCLPRIKSIAYGMVSPNGTHKFVYSYTKYDTINRDAIFYIGMSKVTPNSSGNATISSEKFVVKTIDTPVNPALSGCEYITSRFTSPLVYDIDDSLSNGEEIIIGTAVNSDSFKLFSYNYAGVKIDEYPEITDGEGILVSNPVIMSAFPDSSRIEPSDFCVLGFESTDNTIDLLCASEGTGIFGLDKSTTFSWDVPAGSLMPSNVSTFDISLMATQQLYETTDNVNLDEIASMYGIFKLDFTAFDELELLYELHNPGSIIVTDAENVGATDLLVLDTNILYYIDDGYTNNPVNEMNYVVNPCIEQTWKVSNASGDGVTREVFVSILPTDAEGDMVSAKAILYADSPYEQESNWSDFSTSGSSIPFSFPITDSTAFGTLRLMAKDYINQDDEDILSVDLAFSVSTSGVEFGDCSTDGSKIITPGSEEREEEFDDLLETDVTNNSIYSGFMRPLSQMTGLGLPIIWILLLLFISIYIIVSFHDKTEAFWGVGLLWVGGMVLGVMLGFIGVGIVILFAVCGIVALGLFIWRKFFGA